MRICFRTPGHIEFGVGSLASIGNMAKQWKVKYALVTGGNSARRNGFCDQLERHLAQAGVDFVWMDAVMGEPDSRIVDAIVAKAKAQNCGGVISLGGGSAMDAGKCLAGLLHNEGSVCDYLEGVGMGAKLKDAPAIQIAIPTTAGTGAEATNNAVLVSIEEAWKRSIRDDWLFADVALVDPALTVPLSPQQTAYCGMDTLAQLIEAYTCSTATPFSDMCALMGLEKARALADAVADGENIAARSDMAMASLLSGMAISNAGVTACHGLASGFGGAMGIPHGLACGILLTPVMQLNCEALPGRFSRIAEVLTGKNYMTGGEQAAVDAVKELAQKIGIPDDFSQWNLNDADTARVMVGKSNSSLSKNAVQMDEEGWEKFVRELI